MDNAAREAWLSVIDPEVRQLTLEALQEGAANIGNQAVKKTQIEAQKWNRKFRDEVLGPIQDRLRPMLDFARNVIDSYRLDRANSKDFWAGLADSGVAGLTQLVENLGNYAAEQRGQAEALRQKVANNIAARAAIANVTNNNAT